MAYVLLRFPLRLPSPSSRIPLLGPCLSSFLQLKQPGGSGGSESVAVVSGPKTRKRLTSLVSHAVVAEDDGPKWWEKNVENMVDVHSTEEFLHILSQAEDRLVIVEFYGTWCGSCRALFPKLCRTAEEHPDIVFVKVNFDENKPMCKRLNVRVLPYFHFYRGADGHLESFSCSFAKFHKIKDAIAIHNTARCSIGPPASVGDIGLFGASPKDKPAKAT